MNWTVTKNEEQYQLALECPEEIFHHTDEPQISDEFDLLTLIINKYEEENFEIEEARSSGCHKNENELHEPETKGFDSLFRFKINCQ